MRLALGMCVVASGVMADPLGFVDYDAVGAPYVDDLVDMGDGVSVAVIEDGVALVRLDNGTQFMCDPRDQMALGTAMMAMLDVAIAEGHGCLAFGSVEAIMTSVNLRNDVVASYSARLAPQYDRLDVEERFYRAVRSALGQRPGCPAQADEFLTRFTNPEFVAAVTAAIDGSGLPVQNCPGWVALP